MSDKKTIVLSAGGTGGHLFPAEALAQELLARGHKVIILTDKRGNAFKSLGDRVEIKTVRAAYLKAGIFAKIKAVADMGAGIAQAAMLLRKYKPDIVVGFGGYPSFPGVFAAQKLGIPTVLHEQNAILGKANVWLADGAGDIATSFPDTKGIKQDNKSKTVTTGNPVRADIVAVRADAYAAPQEDVRILVTGGSQGASVFGEIVPEAIAKLPDDLKRRLVITHQVRENDLDITAKKYETAGVKAEIKTFFNDMADRLKKCHLFIGRSGASTVTEIAVVGRPAIFVPYPGHQDMQQKHNADVVADKGGAWVMLQPDFTADALATRLGELMRDPALLDKAAAAAKACGQPDAAARLADVVEKKLKGPKT
jgi:UDP-N-acetylglucosamine--N-acetylmuramyl-(pentapeptide) pyrophosphoryl-undecaprenol N-acetylglucosamine transferase